MHSEQLLSPPTLSDADLAVIAMVEDLRATLDAELRSPRRWTGDLRRMTLARAVQGSSSIEGYNATLDDVAAIVDGQPAFDADDETQAALRGYRDAMSYVLQVATDNGTIDATLIKALHFMMMAREPQKDPGRWRSGEVFVHRDLDGARVYTGPDAEVVPKLVESMIQETNESVEHALINAAMVHLNFVMIHPFRDGNGRMARVLQTLVLARKQIHSPVLVSIEEYLGHNTQAYYDVLAEVGRGARRPDADTRPWIRFVLTAHYRQAKTHAQRSLDTTKLWSGCSQLVEQAGITERSTAGLVEVAHGFRLRNSGYRKAVEYSFGEEISELTASRDLKAMVDASLLVPVGERRGRHYIAAPQVAAIQAAIRAARPPEAHYDPYSAFDGA